MSWRATRGDWKTSPDGFGLWEVRHVRNGELRHVGRVGIVPAHFNLSIEPGTDMKQGHLIVEGAMGIKISGAGAEAKITAKPTHDGARVHVAARDASSPPVRIGLRLHWQGQAELVVQAPFPGGGGRFVHNGQPLTQKLAVDDLYGVRAVARSPSDTQRFRIEAELRAPDLGTMVRLAQIGTKHELPLVDLRPKIARLLAASTSSDASVTLRIVDHGQQEYAKAEVGRFTNSLNRWQSTDEIWLLPPPDAESRTTFEAWPIAEPMRDPVALETVGKAPNPHGVKVPSDLDLRAHRMLVVGHCESLRIEPMAIGGTEGPSRRRGETGTRAVMGLSGAVNIADDRQRWNAIAQTMDAMLTESDPMRGADDWEFLHDTLLRHEGLPASTSTTRPAVQAACSSPALRR